MAAKSIFGAAFLAAFLIVGSATAQSRYQSWEQPRRNDSRMFDELRDLIREAEQARAADPRFLNDLRDLIRRYETPWRKRLLSDDFRDGNYTQNPTWKVVRGDFHVPWGGGLVCRATPVLATTAPATPQQRPRSRDDNDVAAMILQQILRGRRDDNEEKQTQTPAPAPQTQERRPAEIFLAHSISNSFLLEASLVGAKGLRADFEIGVYQGAGRNIGYRLSFDPKDGITLLRLGSRGAAVIELNNTVLAFADGKERALRWQRHPDGTMSIAIDGKVLFSTVDRAFRDPFNGILLINRGEDLTLRQITVDGV